MTVIAQNESQHKPDTERFYNDIRKQYKSLSEKKKHGVKIYTNEYIFAEIGRQFYRSPRTIENILFNRV